MTAIEKDDDGEKHSVVKTISLKNIRTVQHVYAFNSNVHGRMEDMFVRTNGHMAGRRTETGTVGRTGTGGKDDG